MCVFVLALGLPFFFVNSMFFFHLFSLSLHIPNNNVCVSPVCVFLSFILHVFIFVVCLIIISFHTFPQIIQHKKIPLIFCLQLYVPMYPLKGYNFIIPLKNDITQSADAVPKRIVAFRNVYMTRFHNDLRVTAIGQFAGWDTTPTPVIADKLKQFSKRLFPHLESEIENEGRMSVGLRPFVADGLLLVGRVPPYHNLYVNSGPGSNGWKLCVGSGRVLAASVEKNEKKNREEEEEGEKEKEGEEVVVVEEEKREKENLGMELFDPKGRIVYSPFFCSLASFFHRGSVLGKWGKL